MKWWAGGTKTGPCHSQSSPPDVSEQGDASLAWGLQCAQMGVRHRFGTIVASLCRIVLNGEACSGVRGHPGLDWHTDTCSVAGMVCTLLEHHRRSTVPSASWGSPPGVTATAVALRCASPQQPIEEALDGSSRPTRPPSAQMRRPPRFAGPHLTF